MWQGESWWVSCLFALTTGPWSFVSVMMLFATYLLMYVQLLVDGIAERVLIALVRHKSFYRALLIHRRTNR